MMATKETESVGRVVGIWRYPVKSMLGEELDATQVTERGLLGDRAFAMIDAQTGKVASAKNPRLWPRLFDFRAAYVEPPRDSRFLPPARITPPDGESLSTEQADVESRLSAAVGRRVTLARAAFAGATAEGYWPDHDWLQHRDEVFEFQLPEGTFFDGATIHVITTATLARLQRLAQTSRFDVRRFRPNFLIEPTTDDEGFVENGWIGKTITVGEVALRIDGPCPRCVMTTLCQGELPKDPGVLRTVVEANAGNVGVYAAVLRSGRVRRDAEVHLV
jgi:uncharacterized protein YcbX